MNAPFLGPCGCPVGVEPAVWRRSIAKRIEALHDAMQALIAALDVMDGDPDLEPSIVGGMQMRGRVRAYVDDDREGGDVLDEGEPSLGWTLTLRQEGKNWHAAGWAAGLDVEAEHDGREPGEECWRHRIRQPV